MLPLYLAISFCGGCNPQIDREALADTLERRCGAEDTAGAEGREAWVIINGCPAACGSLPAGVPPELCLVVAGPLFEGKRWRSREELVETLLRRAKGGLHLSSRS